MDSTIDPLKSKFILNLPDICDNYDIKTSVYSDFGLGLCKGINFNNKPLKYLFLTITFYEPLSIQEQLISISHNKIKICEQLIKYPTKIYIFHPKFFLKDFDRFYGDEQKVSYDNGNCMMEFINLNGMYHLALLVFRVDLTKFPIFKITNIKETFDAEKCVACMDKMSIIRFNPCNHICMCFTCYNSLYQQKCPVCNCYIEQTD